MSNERHLRETEEKEEEKEKGMQLKHSCIIPASIAHPIPLISSHRIKKNLLTIYITKKALPILILVLAVFFFSDLPPLSPPPTFWHLAVRAM